MTPKISCIASGAELDLHRKYRYALWRIWDRSKPWVLFIGLNPSTADERCNDRTLDKCIHYASVWGYGGVYMANLFAYRATDPDKMKKCRSPIGPENDEWLIKLHRDAGMVVAAWGNDGAFKNRAEKVCSFLGDMHCIKINHTGEPAHPLYQLKSAKPQRYIRA